MKHKDIIVTAMALVALLISMSTIRGPESAAADSLPSAAAAPLFSPMGTGFSYQGQLRDSGGSSITDTCDFRFTLWDSVSDGTQIGSESTAIGVGVVDGYFNALVNDGGEFGAGAFNGEGRWLEIDVKCTGDPDWTALSPRQSLTPTPYAIYAASIGPHDHWGEVWTGSGTGLSLSGGSTGLSGSGSTSGVYGESAASDGHGVDGYASASSDIPVGVYGWADNAIEGRGVEGLGGTGVYGSSSSTMGNGIYGFNSASIGVTRGVYGISDSTSGRGVEGSARAISGTTFGVYGLAASGAGYGVYGDNNASSGKPIGVKGWADNASGGIGVVGEGAIGVEGFSDNFQGIGVYGYATSSSDLNYGVYGLTNSSNGYAGYFDGNVKVTGTLTGNKAEGFFPRPAYDSGFVSVTAGTDATWTHSVGSNEDDYLVDLQCQSSGLGIHSMGNGFDQDGTDQMGAYYHSLNSTDITVHRGAQDVQCESIRIRIWHYR